MKIKRLFINNYKSLVNFELVEPNPFSVFVGPNAAGKSNVFEALEFLTYTDDLVRMDSLFGGANAYLNKQLQEQYRPTKSEPLNLQIELKIGYSTISANIDFVNEDQHFLPTYLKRQSHLGTTALATGEVLREGESYPQWFNRIFSRIFIQNTDLVKLQVKTPHKLALDAGNLPAVLNRILNHETKREEILEWMECLIPEFETLQVKSDPVSGEAQLFVKEKSTGQYFPKNLLSDGTYNILALLTAVYQSDEPQFLCIEEPENGLAPFVLKELVEFFRQICEEMGHIIWLNTHSPYLIRQLKPKEIILTEKRQGITWVKQVDKSLHFQTMKMDEAWLSNALGGGLPW